MVCLSRARDDDVCECHVCREVTEAQGSPDNQEKEDRRFNMASSHSTSRDVVMLILFSN